MTAIIYYINAALTGLFDALCWAFSGLAPAWGVFAVSLPAGLLMLWVFGKTSNQPAIAAAKERIGGNLIGVRLFQNDLRVVLGLQWRILRETFTYLRLGLFPLLILLVPFVLICAQLNLRFGARPLKVEEAAVVKATFRDALPPEGAVTLETPPGVALEALPVRIPSQREIAWRVRAKQPGRHALTVRSGDEAVEKLLVVGEGWEAVSTHRTGQGILDALLFPGEKPLASSSALAAVDVVYSPLAVTVFGWRIHWLLLFVLLTVIFGYAFKGVMGVSI